MPPRPRSALLILLSVLASAARAVDARPRSVAHAPAESVSLRRRAAEDEPSPAPTPEGGGGKKKKGGSPEQLIGAIVGVSFVIAVVALALLYCMSREEFCIKLWTCEGKEVDPDADEAEAKTKKDLRDHEKRVLELFHAAMDKKGDKE
mmetsp:Transcript_18393/g.54650  ORF Transcript_18393/g.54650 Transcript_18393/m.54650 type:complete len:148 (+) Transcript_18393:123-566(+)